MSEITTSFTSYFEDSNDLDYVFNGLVIHSKSDKEGLVDYFNDKSETAATFFNNASFGFVSLFKEEDMIVGLIQGGTITYSPEQLLESLASLGCTMSVAMNDYDQVGESDSFGYKGKRKVKYKTVLTALKKISPTFAFKFAITANQSKLALELLENGANPNTIINQRHAIEFVASNSNWKLLRKIVKCGADINAQSPNELLGGSQVDLYYEGGMTAMHHVASRGDLGLLKFLIDNGATLDIQNSQGESSLFRAVMYDSKKQIDYLVESGADVNLKDKEGMSPFLYILNEPDYNLDTIKLFIRYGADINTTCGNGGNALWYVNERLPVDHKAVDYIKSFGINFHPPKNVYSGNIIENFMIAIQHGDERFLNRNLLPTDPDELIILLFAAITSQRLSIVKRLIDANADPMRVGNLTEDIQIHSLDLARSDGSYEIRTFLTNICQAQLADEKKYHDKVKTVFMDFLKYINENPLDYNKHPGDTDNLQQLLGMKKYFSPSYFKKEQATPEQELYRLKFVHDAANRPYLSHESIELRTLRNNIIEVTKLTKYNGNLSCYYQDVNSKLVIVKVDT